MVQNWKKLLGAIVICQTAGIAGSFFTASAVGSWYVGLNKWSLNPPSWVFGPVWTTLFLLTGIALYYIWLKKGKNINNAAAWFGIQLGLNILWSVFFFGFRQPLWALVEIIFLWIAILITIVKFYKISKMAGYLMMPYILWVCLAIVLNFMIVYLN